ncbi:MAG: type II secretion system ATPase GspE [Gammaproteobacteria bacterium]|nr:type II secretion system ATPase GspE [Gammaproteobacteria bacterium]MBU1732918.1 type II secretion system ATPase GspE [Gammaproteobacteria bacterium]MBU1891966.1 type II secretion system ATPase GspE [Gammaproteobacteria bacterium]
MSIVLESKALFCKQKAKQLTKRLGDILIERGKLDTANLERALRLQQAEGGERIGAILIRAGMTAERDVVEALSAQLGLPLVPATDYPELPVLEESVSVRFLKESKALPLHEDAEKLVLAMADPLDEYVINAFRLVTHREVIARLAVPSELDVAFERLYGSGKSSMDQIVGEVETREEEGGNEDLQQLKDLASEAPIIRLVSLIISHALEARASDIHIEPFENRLIVRYRVDGVMHEVESPPRRFSAAVISRIKIMASLDIAERRLPQDGRIKLRIQGKEIDLRVSTVPTMHGESVVMRILDKSGTALDFTTLGFDPDVLQRFMDVLMQPHGILLVTGPTGSGKTTTLYTALDKLNNPDLKILTVEDPVEYQMEGINQIQVKPQIGLTFANALRSIVRQDPDVIMIGEIRDLETAQIAVQSALTGHMVLSTLHTNDAASTINRLLDMGMDDYLLTSTVNGILAQRLVRTLCSHCREAFPALPEVVEEMKLERYTRADPVMLYRPVGCEECGGTGYMGRLSIVELLVISDAIRSLVMRHVTAGEIRQQAIAEGMQTMYENGLHKAVTGVTTIEEVLRVTREE